MNARAAIFFFLVFGLVVSCSSRELDLVESKLKSYKSLLGRIVDAEVRYQKLLNRVSQQGRLWDPASVCTGRLTTESGVAVSTSDRTSQSTLYFTPYQGGVCALYTGTTWKTHSFTERTLSLSGLTVDKLYDVFLYDDSGTLTLELSAAWTSATARNEAIVLQDGVYVKSGAATRRYLGTLRATAATTTEDSQTKRFVWNWQNRLNRYLKITALGVSWTYNSTTWRSANNNTALRVEFVVGIDETRVSAITYAGITGTTSVYGIGVGLDRTNGNDSLIWGGGAGAAKRKIQALYEGYPGIGYHYLQWVEKGHGSNTPTFYSDTLAGILAHIEG